MEKLIRNTQARLGLSSTNTEIGTEQYESLHEIATNRWAMWIAYGRFEPDAYKKMGSYWINEYFRALAKETLARVRTKINAGFTEEIRALLNEAQNEMRTLDSMVSYS